MQQSLIPQAVRPGQNPRDLVVGTAGLTQAVGHDLQTVGGGLLRLVDNLVGPVGQNALPGAASVEGADRGAGKEGGPDTVAGDGQTETGVVDIRGGPLAKTGFAHVEDGRTGDVLPAIARVDRKTQAVAHLVVAQTGDGGIEKGRCPHAVTHRIQRADRTPTQAVEFGEGHPVGGEQAAGPAGIEAGQAALGGDPQVATAPRDIADLGAE